MPLCGQTDYLCAVTDLCAMCGEAVVASAKFDGSFHTTEDGKVHAECYGEKGRRTCGATGRERRGHGVEAWGGGGERARGELRGW